MKKLIPIVAFIFICLTATAQQKASKVDLKPSGTFLFARKDSCSLYLDCYAAAPGSSTEWNNHTKPAILFMFGGGFKSGRRDEDIYKSYYKLLVENGYPVVAIDYRLGMKDAIVKNPVSSFGLFYDSIHLAVEDLYSATSFLIGNADKTGIDPYNMVIAGSSAGAIAALQGAWELLGLQKGRLGDTFPFKGVISFAGGVISKSGKPAFSGCCPVLLFQGKDDRIVNYKKMQLFNLGFFGSSVIRKSLNKAKVPNQIFRFNGIGHEIAGHMTKTFSYQDEFIKKVVMDSLEYDIDASITDPTIKKWDIGTTSDLYRKK